MKKKKFYLVILVEINGEQEYTQQKTIAIDKSQKADNVADEIAKGWYADEAVMKDERGVYQFFDGEISVHVKDVIPISDTEFTVLNKFNI